MKTTLILSILSTAFVHAQQVDSRENRTAPTNSQKTEVQHEDAEITERMVDAPKAQSDQRSKNPADQFLEAYMRTQEGLSHSKNSNPGKAREMFLSARAILKNITKDYPEWQPTIVNYRLDYLQKLLDGLQE